MASVSDPCDAVNANPTASQDKTGQMPAIYQGLAICLKDPDKKYEDKVCAVLATWERLASSSLTDNIQCLIECLFSDTLRLILRGEWPKLQPAVKTHLSVVLKQTSASLGNAEALSLCRIVSRLVQNPWEDSTLSKILVGKESVDDEEAEKFCVSETPSLLVMRLEMLCDSKCEDLALRLLQVCLRCLRRDNGQFVQSCTKQNLEFFTDLNVALLYRNKYRSEIISHLQQLSNDEEHQLVERFLKKRATDHSCRIWRSSLKIAQFVSGYCLARALVKLPPPTTLAVLTTHWLTAQKQLGVSNHDLVEMLKKLVAHSETSAHMYTVCTVLREEKDPDLKALCIELYVRAAVVDVNDLERRKLQGDSEGVCSTELTLADTFSALADLASSNVTICRECVLTAFSLEPTRQRFEKLQNLAKASYERKVFRNQDSPSPGMEHPPAGSGGGPGDCASSLTFHLKDVKRKESFEDADSGVDINDVATGINDLEESITSSPSPYTAEAANSLGVSKQIMNDLAVVLHSPRWEVLNWGVGWSELRPLCERYLENQECMRSVTKELKYLNIDYSQFEHMPKVERGQFDGIEKGYETFVQQWSSEEELEPPIAPLQENVDRRVRQPKRKHPRTVPTGRLSVDSDSSASRLSCRRKIGRPKKYDDFESHSETKRKESAEQVKALRMFRPAPAAVTRADDSSKPSSSFPVRLSQSNKTQAATPCNIGHSDHFAPLLSTLNMNPKIVLTRTPVHSPSSSPLKTVHNPKERTKGSPVKDRVGPIRKGSIEMAGKLDLLNHGNIQRTLANLKGLDMVQVRRGPTAVHMVELPDPPTSHITSNGISNNGPSSSGNAQNQQQPEQHQEKPPPPSSVEDTRPDLLTAPKIEDDQEETVTLMSTPSVTIFEVAHRPHTSSTVLQPISAITGVSSSNTRARMPLVSANPFSGLRPTGPRSLRAPVAEAPEGSSTLQSGSQALAQLLSQPSSSLSGSAFLGQNGSQSVATYRSQQQPSTSYRNLEPGRAGRPVRREQQQPIGQQQEGSNSSAGDLACRVPLVKYVDLDMVSSPSRIRQNNAVGHRRSSQGSNSSSPDPHHSRNAAKGRGGNSSQNPPTSPSLASPVSPALQPPLSPMASRKPYAYRQDGKSYLPSSADGLVKMGADLKQPSPSHPSQCSSPFSRPSSRSQDASSSPSDLISSIYPSSLVYSASEGVPVAASRTGYSAGSFNSLPALPKFQQAFGKKTNFSALPTLAENNVVPEVSHLPDPQQQHQPRGFIDRRFSEQQNSPAEEEGLGSKLQSLLESALNGHIGRSPSRHPSGHSQLLQPADLLLPAGLSDSPFGQVSNDSALLSSLEPNSSTLEQLREFESIFERVASTSQLKEQHPWTDLGQADDTSFLPSGVEYLVPSAGYSTSLDTVTSSVEDTLRPDSGLEAEGPLIHLLNVASAARQALEEEENKSNESSQPDETGQDQVDAKTELAESPQDSQQPTLTVNTLQEHAPQPLVTSPDPSAAAAMPEATKPATVTTTPPGTCTATVKTETASSSKSNRNKQGVKSSPAVSPGSSGVNASKGSSSASAAAPKAPQKAHDDEQTVLRVNAILEEYREQLRNSPDLQNKPAPRRRSNPLPSPTATPKRRKSSQSKVKLLSQHARPLDSTDTAGAAASTEGSAASSGAAAESSPGSDQLPETVLPEVKAEVAATSTSTTAPSETVAILTGVAKSAPFKIATQAAEAAAPQSNNVTSTVTNASISLAGGPNLPIAVQQVLVTSQAGVRQVLLPVSIAGPFRQALVRGTSQRFVTVRPVTVGGASGFISLPARLPLTVRTISTPLSAENALSSAVAAAAHVVTSSAVTVASSSSTVTVTKATDTRVSIQDLLTTQVTELIQQQQQQQPQPNVQRPISSTTSTVHWAPSAAQLELSSQKSEAPKPESTVLRFVPTVNRVSLPLFESTSLLAVENRPPPHEVITETLDEQEWTAKDQDSPKSAEAEATVASTAAVIVPDDKLLIEDGVSEFLPCADFTGPGVSPSPCFAFTDSPLESQNSSRAASPTPLQVPPVEGEVATSQTVGSPVDDSATTAQAKLVRRNEKPKWVMLRNDHGAAEYRRVNDTSQCASTLKDGGKKSGNKRSSKKTQPPVSEIEPANTRPGVANAPQDPLHITEAEAVELERLNASANNSPVSLTPDLLVGTPVTLEMGSNQITDCAEDPLQLDDSVHLEEASVSPCDQHREAGHVSIPAVKGDGAQTESAAATAAGVQSAPSPNPGSGASRRRFSNRGHVKKNCPCCTGDPDTRKRSRSESSAGESSPALADCTVSAKRPSSAKSDTTTATTTKSPKAKKTPQQRKR